MRIDNVVTSGLFKLDGGEWEVDNNIWILGDDSEVFVIDAAHTAQPVIDAVAGRTVKGILCSHAHNDHITVAPELSGQRPRHAKERLRRLDRQCGCVERHDSLSNHQES